MSDFRRDLEHTLFGGDMPSWGQIRDDARRLLRSTRVTGGEQESYDKSMDRLIKPDRGEFADDDALLAEALERDVKLLDEGNEE